jgi:hypothetical protein
LFKIFGIQDKGDNILMINLRNLYSPTITINETKYTIQQF